MTQRLVAITIGMLILALAIFRSYKFFDSSRAQESREPMTDSSRSRNKFYFETIFGIIVFAGLMWLRDFIYSIGIHDSKPALRYYMILSYLVLGIVLAWSKLLFSGSKDDIRSQEPAGDNSHSFMSIAVQMIICIAISAPFLLAGSFGPVWMKSGLSRLNLSWLDSGYFIGAFVVFFTVRMMISFIRWGRGDFDEFKG